MYTIYNRGGIKSLYICSALTAAPSRVKIREIVRGLPLGAVGYLDTRPGCKTRKMLNFLVFLGIQAFRECHAAWSYFVTKTHQKPYGNVMKSVAFSGNGHKTREADWRRMGETRTERDYQLSPIAGLGL